MQSTVVILAGSNLLPLVSEEFLPEEAYPDPFQEEEVLPE